MKFFSTFFSVCIAVRAIEGQSNMTAIVDLGQRTGQPRHWASGFIYGIPDTPNQIPDHFYTEIDFEYGRAGGAQMGEPARGWLYGLDEYRNRLASALSNYRTCRKYGASFVLLPHDLWGTDGANSSTVWPGDNGDWTDYDNFVMTVLSDLKANDSLEAMAYDIWNEPDIGIFWNRSQEQWIDMYVRTHQLIRSNPDYDSILISGPTLAFRPFPDNTWWTNWLLAIAGNNTVPDQYAYHLEGVTHAPDNDLQNTNISLTALLQQYGLPERQININEYGNPDEQRPAGAAFWISRLERYEAFGLRGNWLSGTELHDLMANLLTKTLDPGNYTATDYVPAGEWQVYKYYAVNMTGERTKTNGSEDALFDVYSTVGQDKVRILAGSRITAGTWSIEVDDLQSVGLPAEGEVLVHAWEFPGVTQWTVELAPVDAGEQTVAYSGNTLVISVNTDNTTAHAFEFDVGDGYYRT